MTSAGIGLDDLHLKVADLVRDAPEGEPLAAADKALIQFALCSSVLVLDADGAREHATTALDLGLSSDQLHEALVLISGLGVHTLMEGSRDLVQLVEARDGKALPELDDERLALKARLLGTAPFWLDFEQHVPGFLDSLLRLSPAAFEGFVAYGALPVRIGLLSPLQRELISVAMDSLPGHRYMPGVVLHVQQALRLGASRTCVLQAVELAAAAPDHPGVV